MSNEQYDINDVKCLMCQWFSPSSTHKGEAGECRVNPPQVIAMPGKMMDLRGAPTQTELHICFPTVPANLWCSKFQPRKVNLPQPDTSQQIVSNPAANQ